jgi:glycosyltransferase A (GT-A) superfamily protein (DUF2064 family)
MTVLVVAKAPVPGLTKTRLAAAIGAPAAADVAAAAFLDLLQTLRADHRRTLVALTGQLAASARHAELRDALTECTVFAQVEAPFAARLVHAHQRAQALVPGPLLQIGMDTPQLDAGLLDTAEAALKRYSAVLGPAEDGGWWGLGLHTAGPAAALGGVRMSAATTGAATRSALLVSGLVGEAVGELAALRDVDDWTDAVAVAAALPGSRFAAAVAAVALEIEGRTSKR